MGTQDDKAAIAFGKLLIDLLIGNIKLKPPSCIDIEAVEDNLRKPAMVHVSVPKGSRPAFLSYPSEEMILRQITPMGEQHAERNNEDCGKEICTRQREISHKPHQTMMHPTCTPCRSFPLLSFRHCLYRDN